MNNKGFTLIELLASIILLAVVMSVSTVSVVSVIDYSKKQSYDSLKEYAFIGIKDYYMECANSDIIEVKGICNELSYDNVNTYTTTFGTLLEYGYLKTNSKKEDTKVVVNPTNDKSMNDCKIYLTVTKDSNNNVSYSYEIENKEECNRE